MKTHIVIDMTYHEDEGNEVFVGTLQECNDWVALQNSIGFEVKPMTKEEIATHNPQLLIE
jgi:hypothetical protein